MDDSESKAIRRLEEELEEERRQRQELEELLKKTEVNDLNEGTAMVLALPGPRGEEKTSGLGQAPTAGGRRVASPLQDDGLPETLIYIYI